MGSLIVALPNDTGLAVEIGKKGTQNGITFYNRKSDRKNIVIISPTDLSSKFYAVGEIISLADLVLISTKNVDTVLGESVICSSLMEKMTLFTKENDISSILRGIKPREHEFLERRDILQRLLDFNRPPNGSGLRIDIDKAFPVKGVGTVLLGIVRSGTVKVHDNLKLSSGREVLVRSIQVQDDDLEEAHEGDRVGLSVKGIDDKEVGKGDLLAKECIPYISSFTADIKAGPLSGEIDGVSCVLSSGFSVSSCKVSKKEGSCTIKLDKPLALAKNDKFVLIREKAPRVFAAGTVAGA